MSGLAIAEAVVSRQRGDIDIGKREAVLRAAVEVFGERGANATLTRVAQRAGVSRQTLYNRHWNKQALVASVLDQVASAQEPQIELTQAPLETQLSAYACELLRFVLEPRQIVRARLLFDADARRPGVATIDLPDAKESLRSFLSGANAQGRLDVDEPQRAAELFVDLVAAGPRLRALVCGEDEAGPGDNPQARARACVGLFLRAFPPGRTRCADAS